MIWLALTGSEVAGPVDFSSAMPPIHPATVSAARPTRMAAIRAAGNPGRAACAGRPGGEAVTLWRGCTPPVCRQPVAGDR